MAESTIARCTALFIFWSNIYWNRHYNDVTFQCRKLQLWPHHLFLYVITFMSTMNDAFNMAIHNFTSQIQSFVILNFELIEIWCYNHHEQNLWLSNLMSLNLCFCCNIWLEISLKIKYIYSLSSRSAAMN